MKKYLITQPLLFAIQIFSQSISLPKEAKYKIGDDLAWENPFFNDFDWVKIADNKYLNLVPLAIAGQTDGAITIQFPLND
jgi:hypothetical protein